MEPGNNFPDHEHHLNPTAQTEYNTDRLRSNIDGDAPNVAEEFIDEAFEDGDSPATMSLESASLDYQEDNERRYHAFQAGSYPLPNDKEEQTRLDLHHRVFRSTIGGALFRAPIPDHPFRVLDMGTGTGIWAVEFADSHPVSTVIGVDLSPIQDVWVPPNLKFEVCDLESVWTYNEQEAFDFIHGRAVGSSIKDWRRLWSQIHTHLRPGGYAEVTNSDSRFCCDDDSHFRAPNVLRFQTLITEGSIKFGKALDVARDQQQHMLNAGFLDVQHEGFRTPVGPWEKDRKLRKRGELQLRQYCQAIEPLGLAFLVKALSWTKEEASALGKLVELELNDERNHFYVYIHHVFGKKADAP